MQGGKSAGFTIIETVMFLAITGLLIAGMLVGVGTSVNLQRYHDSVTSLQNTLQTQYSATLNVSNGDRGSTSWSCNSNATVTEGSGPARGQSPNCVILGEYITPASSDTLNIDTVIGYLPTGTVLASDDVQALKQYTINTCTSGSCPTALATTYGLDWGSTMKAPGSDNPLAFSVLIVRSPVSGTIRTFVDPSESLSARNLGTLINTQYLQAASDATVCVVSGNGAIGTPLALKINADSANADGIQLIGNGSAGC